jgi:hypothetical protein
MKNMSLGIAMLLIAVIGCNNPFAPKLDTKDRTGSTIGDTRTIDGFFQTFEFAYNTRDTALYGQLVAPNFEFSYPNFDTGNNETWLRDVEMRTTNGFFSNADFLNLRWNSNIGEPTVSTLNARITRTFILQFSFRGSTTTTGRGFATILLVRPDSTAGWTMSRWEDNSQF